MPELILGGVPPKNRGFPPIYRGVTTKVDIPIVKNAASVQN
jgi:hypothetical protein